MTSAQSDDLDPLAREFVSLVHRGDAPALTAFLAREPAFRSRINDPFFSFDAPAIVQCAWRNDRATIDALLDAGANPNERSQWWAGGWHALDACGPELAAHLISRGAIPDICAASHLGMTNLVRDMLAENPLLVYTRGGDGMTPLHVAADTMIAAMLLECEADIEARDADHVSTPAQWAVKDRHDVCRLLIQEGATEDPFMAASIGDMPYLRDALAADPSLLDARTDEERFPCPGSTGGHMYQYVIDTNTSLLHAAARYGQIEAAKLLLKSGIRPGIRAGYDNATPLHIAAWHGQPAMASFLIDVDADIGAESGPLHHNTPLGWAIVGGKADVVQVLLDRGARLRDYHIDDAKDALAGRFRDVTPNATESDRRKILSMLERAASGTNP